MKYHGTMGKLAMNTTQGTRNGKKITHCQPSLFRIQQSLVLDTGADIGLKEPLVVT